MKIRGSKQVITSDAIGLKYVQQQYGSTVLTDKRAVLQQ